MQVLPKDVIGILWLDVGLYGKLCGAFQFLGIALFRQFNSMFNDGDKAEQGHSAHGDPLECPGQSCVHNQSSPHAGKWSGKGEKHQHSSGV